MTSALWCCIFPRILSKTSFNQAIKKNNRINSTIKDLKKRHVLNNQVCSDQYKLYQNIVIVLAQRPTHGNMFSQTKVYPKMKLKDPRSRSICLLLYHKNSSVLPAFGNNGGSGSWKFVRGKVRFVYRILENTLSLKKYVKAVILPIHGKYDSRCCIITIYS